MFLFEQNVLEGNGRFGISIGHKDTDNLLLDNQVRANHEDGIYFRDESAGMAGIRVRGETCDLVLKKNIIRETRQGGEGKQTVGIRLEENVGPIVLEENQVEAAKAMEDRRRSSKQ